MECVTSLLLETRFHLLTASWPEGFVHTFVVVPHQWERRSAGSSESGGHAPPAGSLRGDRRVNCAAVSFHRTYRTAFRVPAPVNDGQWHHVALQVGKSQQTMFVDEVSLGTVDSEFQLDVTPVAQLGAGAWRGFVGADNARWKVFRGSIENAVLAPGVVSPKVLALLGSSAK